jgi:hypothetical protein
MPSEKFQFILEIDGVPQFETNSSDPTPCRERIDALPPEMRERCEVVCYVPRSRY